MATSRDVAKLARVSQATVSRVISNNGAVSEATRVRVLAAMESVGYVPDLGARAMKTGVTNTIGVVVDDLGNPWYPYLLDALTAALDAAGKKVSLWTSNGRLNEAALDAMASRSVDGVIFTAVIETSEMLKAAIRRQSRFVLVHRGVEGLPADQVTTDNFDGGRMVAEFFIQGGHRSVAIIGASNAASTTRDRRRGFVHALNSHDIALTPEYIAAQDYTYDFGYLAAGKLLDLPKPPTALFCTNDVSAMGALDCVRNRGLRVPDDMWVVGFDDIPMASWKSYDLTSVRQPVERLATIGTRLMLERLEDGNKPVEKIVLGGELIQRGTTG
ncbi:LacI family DNA-binding transcriptional regulator [soil metagenome]